MNVLCTVCGKFFIWRVSLSYSLSHLWKMPEKGCSSNCRVLFIALWLPQCCLWNYTLACFVSISSPEKCNLRTAKPHFQWRKSTMNTVWSIARKKDTYVRYINILKVDVFILLSNNNPSLIVQLKACKHICYCHVLQQNLQWISAASSLSPEQFDK